MALYRSKAGRHMVSIHIWLRLRKNKWLYGNKIDYRQLANIHDLDGEDTKLSP